MAQEILIKPLELTEQTRKLLVQVLKTYGDEVFLSPGLFEIDITDANGERETIEVRLETGILRRERGLDERGNRKPGYRYEIADEGNIVGAGSLGKVYRSNGTIEITDQDELIVKQTKKRIIKAQIHRPDVNAATEAALAELAKLGAKPLAQAHGIDFIVMHELMGESFLDLMKRNARHQFSLISIDKLIDLSIQALRALQEQVHDVDIVHRDIKPDNLFYDASTGRVIYLDFGFSQLESLGTKSRAGSWEYVAPEVLNYSINNQKSDLFSLGRVLRVLWGGLPISVDYQKEKSQLVKETLGLAKNDKLADLFSMLPKNVLSKKDKDNIKAILAKLLSPDPDGRGSIKEAIEQFESLRLDRKLAATPNFHKQAVLEAYVIGHALKNDLAQFARSPSGHPLKDLKEKCINAMANLDNSKLAIEEFIYSSDIKLFKGCKNKKELELSLINTISQFDKNLQRLTELDAYVQSTKEELKQFDNNPSTRTMRDTINKLSRATGHLIKNLIKPNAFITLDLIDTMNQRFNHINFSSKNSPIVTAQLYLGMEDLKNTPQSNTSIATLKKALLTTMQTYIESTYTEKNITNQDRALSLNRIKDMDELMGIILSNDDEEKLVREFNERLQKIQIGKFAFLSKIFSHSTLKNNLHKVLTSHIQTQKLQHSSPKRP